MHRTNLHPQPHPHNPTARSIYKRGYETCATAPDAALGYLIGYVEGFFGISYSELVGAGAGASVLSHVVGFSGWRGGGLVVVLEEWMGGRVLGRKEYLQCLS